ncbi:MAG: radical SAM protein, partial [Deltaproteobacteria bacterium]|nr:radical SAM protein [Deltaproteobacteria bacterium]
MVLKTRKSTGRANETEIGAIRKSWRGRVRFALIYPNRYHLGMSNLGFQSVYRLLNDYDHVVCERVFLPEPTSGKQKPLRTFESGKRLTDADVIAFSLSFENDYPHILSILDSIGLPLRAEQRGDHDPLLLAGGVASFINPEPIAAFFDCFLIGEAEVMLPRFLEVFKPGNDKHTTLISIARNVPGAYVPAFYGVDYQGDG